MSSVLSGLMATLVIGQGGAALTGDFHGFDRLDPTVEVRLVPGASTVAQGRTSGGDHAAAPNGSFVNWESPHIHPIDLTPDGSRVLVVNTADNRLEIMSVLSGTLIWDGSVAVGLEPVTVRARSDDEAWVVNHISDTISVVDLNTANVVATIRTGDEPTDVVFAGAPLRAFVCVSQLNQIRVFDPFDLAAPPVVIEIEGEDPRALATDGETVYAAIFESGTDTTMAGRVSVSSASRNPYPGTPNPPPNVGLEFVPPIAPGLPPPPVGGVIVRRDAQGNWRDVNGADWSSSVTWDLHGHDVAAIDAGTLGVSYARRLMNLNMGLAVSPAGNVLVVGTEAINEVRFEPNLRGIFVRVVGAVIPSGGGLTAVKDLNGHLDYTTPTVPQPVRDQSIGDPRGVAWSNDGRAFVTGMGSNNLVALDSNLNRLGLVEVGEGPTGIAVHESAGVLYVLNRFEATISVVDMASLEEVDRIGYFDPTPDAIRLGRPHLYDTHRTSGLGQASCASCHVDGRMDQLSWDLGDPTGEMKRFDQDCLPELGPCFEWHPMKGPMTTQSMIGIIGTEPFHWRGDRADLADFNGAFVSLNGDDEVLTEEQLSEFFEFVASLTPPPNPYRQLDGSLATLHPNGGNPVAGEPIFTTMHTLNGETIRTCVDCHAMPNGTSGLVTFSSFSPNQMDVPHQMIAYEKTGFDQSSQSCNRGFGIMHDGARDEIRNAVIPDLDAGQLISDQQLLDLEAFLFSFSTRTHASVGTQATIDGSHPQAVSLRDQLIGVAETGAVGLVAKGIVDDESRGYFYMGGGLLQSDRAAEIVTVAGLDASAGPGREVTYTVVPLGSEQRIGVDRDEDGFFDRDELDDCSDPTDPSTSPGGPGAGCCEDVVVSGHVGFEDLTHLLNRWGPCAGCPADLDGNGDVGFADLTQMLSRWGPC